MDIQDVLWIFLVTFVTAIKVTVLGVAIVTALVAPVAIPVLLIAAIWRRRRS